MFYSDTGHELVGKILKAGQRDRFRVTRDTFQFPQTAQALPVDQLFSFSQY